MPCKELVFRVNKQFCPWKVVFLKLGGMIKAVVNVTGMVAPSPCQKFYYADLSASEH